MIEAYSIAAEGHDLAYFKEMLADHMAAMKDDAEARAEREAKKASKAKRKSGEVSVAAADDDDDAMDVDEEGRGSKPKSKKRKKSLDSEGGEEKVRLPCLFQKFMLTQMCAACKDAQDWYKAQAHNTKNSSGRCFEQEKDDKVESVY